MSHAARVVIHQKSNSLGHWDWLQLFTNLIIVILSKRQTLHNLGIINIHKAMAPIFQSFELTYSQ